MSQQRPNKQSDRVTSRRSLNLTRSGHNPTITVICRGSAPVPIPSRMGATSGGFLLQQFFAIKLACLRGLILSAGFVFGVPLVWSAPVPPAAQNTEWLQAQHFVYNWPVLEEAKMLPPTSGLPTAPSEILSSYAAIDLQQVPATTPDYVVQQPSFSTAPPIDLDPKIIEGSPVLQRWLRQVPDVMEDIANNPSFRTRLRLGYSQFPSTNQAGGINLGVEDVFIGRTGLTISADYQTSFSGDTSANNSGGREAWGTDLHYYLRPLGSYINVSPVLGYRQLETNLYSTSGLNLGVRLLLVLSRGGGADITVTQTWVAPTTDNEVGITTLSVGFALTQNLRLSTDLQQQNAKQRQDSRVGIVLEWMP